MEFTINSNGNVRGDFAKALREMMDAQRATEAALQGVMVLMHGRNYQTCENPSAAREADLKQLTEASEAAAMVGKFALDFGIHIVEQKQ